MLGDSVPASALEDVSLSGPDTIPARRRLTRLEVGVEALKALPNLVRLCLRLLGDPGVPAKTKALLGLSGLYLLSPIDLIPELIFPVIGRVDDVILLAFALHRLIDAVEPSVLQELWDGDEDALELVSAFIAWVGELLPGPLKRVLGG